MTEQCVLEDWFCREVLPLEPGFLKYIRHNSRENDSAWDILHNVYALSLQGASKYIPKHSKEYVFSIAKHHLMRRARRARIVRFEFFADFDDVTLNQDMEAAERHMVARDELRLAQKGIERLPPRCRQILFLRKVEGLTTRETAERLGVGIDAIEQQLTRGMRALTDFMQRGDDSAGIRADAHDILTQLKVIRHESC